MLQNKLLVSVVLLTIPSLIMTKPYLVVTITYNTPAKLVLIKPYGLRNSGDFFIPRYNTTGKNNGFPFLDILGYLKNTHKNPKFGKVRQVPTKSPAWLVLVSLFQIWHFCGYSLNTLKYPKMGIRYFFL